MSSFCIAKATYIFSAQNINDFAIFQDRNFNVMDPVVQSVVSLMSSLRVILLTILADSILSILIFCAEKM